MLAVPVSGARGHHQAEPHGAWRCVRPIGHGGFGRIYLATDGKRTVALKRSPAHLAPWLVHEATALRALRGQRVAELIEDGSTRANPYLALVWHDAPPLTTQLGVAHGRAQILELAVALAAALAPIHALGIAHGDLQPANLLLCRDGIRIIDWATAVGPGLGRAPAGVATPSYAGPEIGHDVGPAADVYAIAAILYHFASGRAPFSGDRRGVRRAHRLLAPPSLDGTDRTIAAALLAGLEKQPSRRPPSVTALVSALHHGFVDNDLAAPTAPPPRRIHVFMTAAAGAVAQLPMRASTRPWRGDRGDLARTAAGVDARAPFQIACIEPGEGGTRWLHELELELARRGHHAEHMSSSALVAETPFDEGSVLLIDDLHRATAAMLDRLTVHAMTGGRRPVVAIARPDLARLRPTWPDVLGDRWRTIAPPTHDERVAIARDHLAPVRYVPRSFLDELVAGTRSLAALVARCAELRERACVTDSDGDEVHLALPVALATVRRPTASVDALTRLPLRLRRTLAVVARTGPAERVVLRAVCARLSPWVAADPDTAFDALLEHGWLHGTTELAVSPPAIGAALDAAGEHATEIHNAALAVLGPHGDPAAVAPHLRGLGHRHAAASAYVAAARAALQAHDLLAAIATATEAIADAAGDAATERAARCVRARAAYRLQRYDDALRDLEAARPLATGTGEEAAHLELDLAIVHDWRGDLAAAAACTATATALADPAPGTPMAGRLALARGRDAFRAEALDLAVGELRQATLHGDRETVVIAQLLLGAAAAFQRRHRDALGHLAAALELGRADGDTFHCATALLNRAIAALDTCDPRGVSDAEGAIVGARFLGNPDLEQRARGVLAYLHLQRGDAEAAQDEAGRAAELHAACYGHPGWPGLMHARALLAVGRPHQAAAVLSELAPAVSTWSPSDRLLWETATAAAQGRFESSQWEAWIERSQRESVLWERSEILALARATARAAGETPGRLAQRALAAVTPEDPWADRINRASLGAKDATR